jgi:hypothetical protein
MRRLLLFLTVFTVAQLQAAKPVPQKGPVTDGGPSVSFDGQSIVASGATRNDVLYAAGIELRGSPYGLGVENRVATATVDADGTARFDMKAHITVRSIWVVVDGKGGYTVFPGPGMARRQMDVSEAGNVTRSDGQVRALTLQRSSVFVFLVRPSVGMWSARLLDGRMNDDDKTINGTVTGAFENLQRVAGTEPPAPDHLVPGDVVFVVDPYSLDYAVTRHAK